MIYVLTTVVNTIMSPAVASIHFDDDPCTWKVCVISATNLDVTEVPFQNNRDLMSLQEALDSMQLNTISPGHQVGNLIHFFYHLLV